MFNCKIYRKFYINSNGYITFKNNFQSPYPVKFPMKLSGYLSKVPIIAPFWADSEGRNDNDKNLVYYSVYQQDDPYFFEGSELTTKVINMVKHDIKTTVSNQGDFIPSLVTVITWKNLVKWPYEENIPKNEFNTFQLVLTTDQRTYRSYIILVYGNNTWTPYPAYSIGYQAPPVDGNYGFFNHYASGKGVETNEEAFNLKNTYGNTNLAGKFIYKVSDTNCERELPEYRCRKFLAESILYDDELRDADLTIPSCPCHGFIAFLDFRFVIDATTSKPGRTICFYSIMPPFFPGPKYFTAPSRQCCYDIFRGGFLMTGKKYDDGSLWAFNPIFYPAWHEEVDLQPKIDCCLSETMCSKFYKKRKRSTCQGYIFPRLTWAMGDPHIRTADGKQYVFNGFGEFWMIKSTKFKLQFRTAKALNQKNEPTDATIFSGVAGEYHDDARITVKLDDLRENLLIYINDATDAVSSWWNDPLKTGLYSDNGLTLSKSNSSLQVVFRNQISLSLEAKVQQLDIRIALPEELKKESVSGLIGTFNGNMSDDFVQPDGTILSENSTERELFTYGKLWRTTAQDSVFFYNTSILESHSSVNQEIDTFEPLFFDEEFAKMNATERDALNQFCGDSYICKVDYAITKNKELANNTKNYNDEKTDEEKKVSNTPPAFDVDTITTLKVEVNNSYQFTLNASDSDNQTIVFRSLNSLPDGSLFDNVTGIFRWTVISDMYDSFLSFVAVDSEGLASSELVIDIQLCNCSGNGKCDWDEPREAYNDTDSFLIVECICDREYEGESCQDDYDGCQNAPCLQLQNCTDLSADEHKLYKVGYNCSSCPPGYTDFKSNTSNVEKQAKCQDLNECASPNTNDCKSPAVCNNIVGGYTCNCPSGYEKNGSYACKDLDECALNIDKCQQKCTNNIGSFACSCENGYVLDSDRHNCTIMSSNKDSCDLMGCSHICKFNPNECDCPNGFILESNRKTCKNIDECSTNTHSCSPKENSTCLDTDGSYVCSCDAGFILLEDKRTCQKCPIGKWGKDCLNSCKCLSADDCDAKTGCIQCPAGYQGGSCEQDINECLDNNLCQPFGECKNEQGRYTCVCEAGYEFANGNCTEINECSHYPILHGGDSACRNGGICTDKVNGFFCNCTSGFNGSRCESDMSVCTPTLCKNNGKCTELTGLNYKCTCSYAYSGVHCDVFNGIRRIGSKIVITNRAWTSEYADTMSSKYKNITEEIDEALVNLISKTSLSPFLLRVNDYQLTDQSNNINVQFNMYTNSTEAVDFRALGLEFHTIFIIKSGERWINDLIVDPSTLSVGLNTDQVYNTKLITVDCSLGTRDWKFSNLDKANITSETKKALDAFYENSAIAKNFYKLTNFKFEDDFGSILVKYQTLVIENLGNEKEIVKELFNKLTEPPERRLDGLSIDISGIKYGSEKLTIYSIPAKINILNWDFEDDLMNNKSSKYTELLIDTISALNNFYSIQSISKSEFIKVSDITFSKFTETPDIVNKVECKYTILSLKQFTDSEMKDLITKMIESLDKRNQTRWLQNLQLDATKLNIDSESTLPLDYPATIRILNYKYEDVVSTPSIKENLTLEATDALTQFFISSTLNKYFVKVHNIEFSAGSVVVNYDIRLLLPTTNDSMRATEVEMKNALRNDSQGLFLKNLMIDERMILIGRTPEKPPTETSGSDNWKVILASVMSVVGVILIVLLVLLLCYVCGCYRKSTAGSSEDSWSDNQSFRPFTSAAYDKKRHWQDAPTLSSASSISVTGGIIPHSEEQRNETSAVDWSVLRGFMKRENKDTGLHRDAPSNTWLWEPKQ
ncbi:DgyrCDS11069 [Dimorphilus gyrociliatus]|nr:DgyrCDS11069 [Dimorphilus gyrociliatus]